MRTRPQLRVIKALAVILIFSLAGCYPGTTQPMDVAAERAAQTGSVDPGEPDPSAAESPNAAQFSPPGSAAQAPGVDPDLTEVEVTGVGLSWDKAEQHAYTRAIEQAVGVLVDAETCVSNSSTN
jgi:hypothetical protein